jgi:hypothetical protein
MAPPEFTAHPFFCGDAGDDLGLALLERRADLHPIGRVRRSQAEQMPGQFRQFGSGPFPDPLELLPAGIEP